MRTIVVALMVMVGGVFGSTLEILQVSLPLSLHGTDSAYEYDGEVVQARVFARPMVLSGAMPESLVEAVGKPCRLAGSKNFSVKESNLLVLFGVEIAVVLREKGDLLVTFDVGELKEVGEEIEVELFTVLKMGVEAIEKTLKEYHDSENGELKVKIVLKGADQKLKGELKGVEKSIVLK